MSRKQYWLTALLSSLTMALLMSAAMSAIRMEEISMAWVAAWMHGFTIAWPVAILANLTILPKIRQLSAWLCRNEER